MDLSTLAAGVHTRKQKKRVGRGPGSGHGKTASRGHKGQYASAGANLPGPLFTGGQTPIHRRLPKRGFTNGTFKKDFAIVNVGDLEERFPAGATVDAAALKETRLVVGTYDGVRILGDGELKAKVAFDVAGASKPAIEKIEKAGGSVKLPEAAAAE